MKNLLLGAMGLILLGGGCVTVTNPESETVENWETAFPSGEWEFVNTDSYSLPVDYSYELRQEGDRVRIQNFVGSDDPNFDYEDNAFFIEITSNVDLTEQRFSGEYQTITNETLGGNTVIKGVDRIVAGDSWPGHGYMSNEKNVVINLYYAENEGGELAHRQ